MIHFNAEGCPGPACNQTVVEDMIKHYTPTLVNAVQLTFRKEIQLYGYENEVAGWMQIIRAFHMDEEDYVVKMDPFGNFNGTAPFDPYNVSQEIKKTGVDIEPVLPSGTDAVIPRGFTTPPPFKEVATPTFEPVSPEGTPEPKATPGQEPVAKTQAEEEQEAMPEPAPRYKVTVKENKDGTTVTTVQDADTGSHWSVLKDPVSGREFPLNEAVIPKDALAAMAKAAAEGKNKGKNAKLLKRRKKLARPPEGGEPA